MLALIIMVAFAIIVTIIGFIYMGSIINQYNESLELYFTAMMNQIGKTINEVTAMEDDLSIAISKLPVSRSKKIQKTEETEETKTEVKVDE